MYNTKKEDCNALPQLPIKLKIQCCIKKACNKFASLKLNTGHAFVEKKKKVVAVTGFHANKPINDQQG